MRRSFLWLMVGLLLTLSGTELILSSSALAQVSEELSAQDAYKKAREAYKDQDLDEALRLLEYAHHKEPSPLFVYNIGRIKAAKGLFRDAYDTFLRVVAMKDTDDNLRRLTESQIEKYKGQVDKATYKIVGVEEGTTVLVGDSLLNEFEEEQELPPGKHRICVLENQGSGLRCDVLKMKAGRRISWDYKKTSAAAGQITIDKGAGIQSLRLDGVLLMVDASKIRVIDIEAGSHSFGYKTEKEEGVKDFQVLPDAKLSWSSTGDRMDKKADQPGESAGVVKGGAQGGAGLWPWVLAGTGVAVAGAGGYFAHSGSSVQSDMEGECTRSPNQQECVDNWDQDRYDNAGSKIDLGMALAGVGGACAVGGVIWWLMSDGSEVASKKTAQTKGGSKWWIQPDPRGGIFVIGRY